MRIDKLEQDLDHLGACNIDALRAFWKDRFAAQPPKLRSARLLRHLIAWRLQVAAYGGLEDATRRAIRRRGALVPEGRDLGIGAVLRRTWQGRTIEVIVQQDGFRWEDKTYPSLSAIARAATGTRWNGPRFFGLRDEAS